MIRYTLALIALAGFAMSTQAQTVIIDEDFQGTLYSNDTHLTNVNSDQATPGDNLFPGWYVTFPTTQRINTILSTQTGGSGGLPQGGEAGTNQGIQFEYQNEILRNDTGHNWSSTDSYTVSLNATEQSWTNTADRWIAFQIRETGGSVIYTSTSLELPQYDAAHDGTGDNWNANQFFEWSFSAGDFTGGTEGSALTFEVFQPDQTGTDQRGMFIDNISFTLVPEPSVFALSMMGFGALWLLRRRKR
jgi:hypothetical protein